MEIDILTINTRVAQWPFVGWYDNRDLGLIMAEQWPYELSKWLKIFADEDNTTQKIIDIEGLKQMEPQLFKDKICDLIQYNKIRAKDIRQIQDIEKYK